MRQSIFWKIVAFNFRQICLFIICLWSPFFGHCATWTSRLAQEHWPFSLGYLWSSGEDKYCCLTWLSEQLIRIQQSVCSQQSWLWQNPQAESSGIQELPLPTVGSVRSARFTPPGGLAWAWQAWPVDEDNEHPLWVWNRDKEHFF